VMTLESGMERILLDIVRNVAGGNPGALEPGLAEKLIREVMVRGQELEISGQVPVLLTSEGLRLWLSRFIRPSYPGLKVLSYGEIPNNKQIKVVTTIGQNQPNAA